MPSQEPGPGADPDAPGPDTPGPDLERAEEVFRGVRGRLFGIAYRVLGSATEAEDVLQEAWIRWQTYDRSTVREPEAFLATTVTRLAINVARSARARHESYVGPWLPEPVDTAADPALGAERGAVLEIAVLMLLERLTPTERAAYVLREAFDYPYDRISEIIGQTAANTRQLVSRARRHVARERRAGVEAAQQKRLLTAFVDAARKGDLSALEELLADDVVSYSDGGGAVRASKFPVVGRERVAKYVRAFADRFWEGVAVEEVRANGAAAVRLSRDGEVFAVVTVAASEEGIDRVLWLMNPAKLGGFAASAES
ncbi:MULTISPECIES: RNA polymerase sigma-70 factor [unclassified Nocardiopsis]|uniref:RNA polymerase sigma-70 factor n=1 Tax=Nocardiopsis TaxID=2013 RepID=UPI00387B024B